MSKRLAILRDRAACFERARSFFKARGILEVDCPALSRAAPIDQHIDVMSVSLSQEDPTQIGYLHTSPEYGMKRLLAEGIGDIYQLSHVFRQGEESPKHSPEFTMAEWYRVGVSLEKLIDETLDFIRLFLGDLPKEKIRYREALIRYAGIDHCHASIEDLLACASRHGLELSPSARESNRDTLLQLLLGFVVEPHLGRDSLCVLYDYPATQAALALTHRVGEEEVAERFEVYYQGIELANGYHELCNASEQRRRLEQAQDLRRASGKDPLKIDEHFLAALASGLPDCCGVAVGFDRLVQLRHHAPTLSDILPLPL